MPNLVTKAITIRRPWIDCIADGPLFKRVENRGRSTSYRGLIALHAAKAADAAADYDPRVVALWGSAPRIGKPMGAVVKVATLVDCHQPEHPGCCGPWGEWLHYGPSGARSAWHLVLANIFHLPEPVYVRGQQAVPWTLPPEVAQKVTAQLAAGDA